MARLSPPKRHRAQAEAIQPGSTWCHINAVMPALVAGIHVLLFGVPKTWMAGTSPAMTEGKALDCFSQ
jgi:hypothetical protein